MSDCTDLIVQNFDYLISVYGFHVEHKEFDSQTMGNAVVVFKSTKFGIEIVVDRNQVLIRVGEQLDPRTQWFELGDVVRYYAADAGDVYVFPNKTAEITWDEVVEIQIRRLAVILRQYCEPMLRGESWTTEEIVKIEKKRVATMLDRFSRNSTN